MKVYLAFLAVLGLGGTTTLNAANAPPRWIEEGPFVDQRSFSLELPIELLANKLYIEVEVGGAPRRFVFDTGSPTMMSASLAEELELTAIDKRTGRDSHGALVETDVVQSELTLGGVTFHKVPTFVAEFPEVAQCLFDGVLGSELLPLCAWQIDLPDSMLRCDSEVDRLEHLDQSNKLQLYDFGYPHAPILDIRFAEKATSKALSGALGSKRSRSTSKARLAVQW